MNSDFGLIARANALSEALPPEVSSEVKRLLAIYTHATEDALLMRRVEAKLRWLVEDGLTASRESGVRGLTATCSDSTENPAPLALAPLAA